MRLIEKKRIKFRMSVLGAFFAVFFSVICGKAVYLQVFRHSYLLSQAENQYEKSMVSRGRRGTIYDSDMRELAVSIDVTSIVASPNRIKDPAGAAEALARILNIGEKTVYERLASNKQFAWIKRQVAPRETKEVRALGIDGIGFIPENSRFYPNTKLAAQVLGFTGVDGKGLEGIEFYYDRILKGGSGESMILKDALGRGIAGEACIDKHKMLPYYNGKNIVLTIDRTIQYIAEKSLKSGVHASSASSGMAVVMDPRTGAVLALAHYPFFNPNAFQNFDRHCWRNRAITDAFEPGSSMKIFCAAAALESGNCAPNTIFYCENGRYLVGEDYIHDTKKHGWLTLHKIIKYSSNIGVVKVSEMIGPESLYHTLRAFGFGGKTGVDCPGETGGSLAPYERWSKIDTGTISFGHGISVSAIQLISAVSAIANDGILMKPYVVKEITDQYGKTVERFGPTTVRRAISVKTAQTVREMMKAVVEKGGTGVKAAVMGYTACGKTGTAQKIDSTGKYADDKYIPSFIGFAPANAPRVAVLVVLDEPLDAYYGGDVAAPVFSNIARETLHYLEVPPEIDPDTEKLTVSLKTKANG